MKTIRKIEKAHHTALPVSGWRPTAEYQQINMNSWKVLKHRDHITMSTSERIRTGNW